MIYISRLSQTSIIIILTMSVVLELQHKIFRRGILPTMKAVE